MKNTIKIAFLALFTSLSMVGMDPQRTAPSKSSELVLFESLNANDTEKVKLCLESFPRLIDNPFIDKDMDPRTVKAQVTPLMLACFKGNISLVECLIKEKKANPQKNCSQGNNALNYCLLGDHNNDLPIIKTILEGALQPYAIKQLLTHVDDRGYSLLERSVLKGNLKLTQYLVELKDFDFNPSINGATALSLAHAKNKSEIAAFLVSKGCHAITDNRSSILASVFRSSSANQNLNLELFNLISYITQPIAPSKGIKGLENGGSLQIIQPRVFEQARKKEDAKCIKEKLEFASKKLGGTPQMHEETSPIFGGTCSYHAMKNALVGLMLLKDYEVLAAQSSERNNSALLARFVNSDITNLTALKTKDFDCEEFAEKLHAKIAVLNNVKTGFEQPEVITLQQGAIRDNMLMAREVFDDAFNTQMDKRHTKKPTNFASKITFIDDQTLRSFITGYRIPNHKSSFTSIQDQELLSQIALFRTNQNYQNAFHFSLNTGELSGYGQSCGINRMHAIAVIIDKKGSKVNALVFESNNNAPYAIKQILFDFIALFTDESKKVMNNTECEAQAALAQDPFNITKTNTLNSVSDVELLLKNYTVFENKCFASKRREDISEALFCLSQIKHAQNILDHSHSDSLGKLFKKFSIDSTTLRAREIKLHNILQSIEDKELNEKMFTFIMQKDAKQTREAIKVGANPNHMNSNGETALTNAVYHGIDVVKALVENNANVNGTNNKGLTPLMNACEQGNLEIIEYLIKQGADINFQDENGNTPLMYLAAASKDEQTKAIIAKELVEKYGALTDLKNKAGQNAAMVYAICGSAQVFKYVIEKQNTSIDLPNLITCITEQQVNLRSSFGPCLNPNALIEYISKNYDLSTKTNQMQILKFAITSTNKRGHIDVLRNLITHKCFLDINAQDEQGWTLLMHAATNDYPDLIKELVEELHVNVTKRNNLGQTAYDICVQHLNLRNLDYFVKNHGYSINTYDCYGSNALHYAATKCDFQTLRNLIQAYKADINTPDSHGRTALMIVSGAHTPGIQCAATECKVNQSNRSDDEDDGMMRSFYRRTPKGHLETVQFLVRNGCDIRTKDAQGLTALDYAKKAGRTNVVDYLTEYINNLPQEPLGKLS